MKNYVQNVHFNIRGSSAPPAGLTWSSVHGPLQHPTSSPTWWTCFPPPPSPPTHKFFQMTTTPGPQSWKVCPWKPYSCCQISEDHAHGRFLNVLFLYPQAGLVSSSPPCDSMSASWIWCLKTDDRSKKTHYFLEWKSFPGQGHSNC